jgi:N-acyl amino acid synthase of PEP-CTERM/exosortase system
MEREQTGGSDTTPCHEFASYEDFTGVFQLKTANNEAERNSAYSLRYQIYCVENKFEDSARFPDEREKDHLDYRSLHGLVLHRKSRLVCGTARLVMPQRDEAEPPATFFEFMKKKAGLPIETTAEVSRFSSSKAVKRQCELFPDTQDFLQQSSLLPHITVSLIAFVIQEAVKNDVTHLCAIMKPALLRLLSRFGVNFAALGDPVEYHGIRQPCFVPMEKLLSDIATDYPRIWEIVTDHGRLFEEGQRVQVA